MIDVHEVILRAKQRGRQILQLNGFTDRYIPEDIGELSNIIELHISGCPNLVALPTTIGRLTSLNKLTIVNAGLTYLPDELGQLTSLRYMRLSSIPIKYLPDALCSLQRLQILQLFNSQTRSIPNAVAELQALEVLNIIDGRFRELPPSITRLKRLAELTLVGGWLAKLPPSLGNLSSLKSLVLRGNFLTELPISFGDLSHLRHLDIEHNRLRNLPGRMRDLAGLETLKLDGTTGLALPPEVFAGSAQGILDFFFRSSRRRPLNEAKILLVGQGGVGKTSLVRRLLDDEFDDAEAKTDGINIRTWSTSGSQQIKLNVWDFGCQEIMHSTHQFFLSKRSLYILVLDVRAGERESNVHYWLEMIGL